MPLVDVHQLSDAITIEHFGDVQKCELRRKQ